MADRSAKEYAPEILAIRCPRCGARPSWACASPKDVTLYVPHLQRKKAAAAQQPEVGTVVVGSGRRPKLFSRGRIKLPA